MKKTNGQPLNLVLEKMADSSSSHASRASVASQATLNSQIIGGGCLPPPEAPNPNKLRLNSAIMAQVATGQRFSVRPAMTNTHPVRTTLTPRHGHSSRCPHY